MNLNNFYDAWWYLYWHPITRKDDVPHHFENLDIFVTKVNPKTGRVSKNEKKNTETAVWLEFGPYEQLDNLTEFWISTHDPRLDCGGKTYEKAIIKLAKLVKKYYGDY